jgi:hypothetical protein
LEGNLMNDKKANHQVKIVRVTEILTHGNADSLEILPIGEYQVVSRKGQFSVGDLAVYIQPDSVIPQTEPFRFIWEPYMCEPTEPGTTFQVPEKRRRITVRKFRGEWSEGLLLPVTDFDQLVDSTLTRHFVEADFPEGTDVSDLLGITHYDPDAGKFETGGESSHAPRLTKKYPKTFKGWYKWLFRRFWRLFHKGPLDGKEESISLGIPTYDVEALKNYPGTFVEGEKVIVTEKIHGCVTNSTKVRLVDGRQKFIRDIDEGDQLLGVNVFGQLVPSTVLKKYNNGKAESWLRVSGKREGLAGRGNSFFAVNCTPEHKFWVEERDQFVEAKDLQIGEHALTLRTDLELTPLQYQVILGKLLGDGYLAIVKNTAALHYGHRIEDKEYVEWTSRGLGQLSNTRVDESVSGYGSKMLKGSSIGSSFVKTQFKCFYEKETKQVPFWVKDELTPIAIAFWYMDDGSLSHSQGQEDRAAFATCGFSKESCGVLIDGLLKFGIESQVADYEYNRIVLNSKNAEKLFLLVAPYIPPCMQRKLPERYRGGTGWLPKSESAYKTTLTAVTIESITVNEKVSSKRYDLETSTHNYFANNILVHNSNARYIYLDGKQYAGSRNLWKSEDSDCIFRRVLNTQSWIGDWCRAHEGYVLWGELTPTQKNYEYGSTSPQLFVFDIRKPDGTWADESDPEPAQLMEHSVPVLYVGPYSLEVVQKHVDGISKVPGAKNIREGIVIKTARERHQPRVGRCQLKIVSNDFLSKDNK